MMKRSEKVNVDFSKNRNWRIFCLGKEVARMKAWMRIWALIIIFLLPILIEEICRQYPNSGYCRIVGPYLCVSESNFRSNPSVYTFSTPYHVIANSGTTTTT